MDLLMEHKWALLVGAEASFWLLSGLFLVLRYWAGVALILRLTGSRVPRLPT